MVTQLGMLDVPSTPVHGIDWWKNPKVRGYAGTPGKGPKGETCRTCLHYVQLRYAAVYRKCAIMRPYWTGGYRTDILATAPACPRWEKAEGQREWTLNLKPW